MVAVMHQKPDLVGTDEVHPCPTTGLSLRILVHLIHYRRRSKNRPFTPSGQIKPGGVSSIGQVRFGRKSMQFNERMLI